jgi:predicted component of type VI protein secretion system
MQPSLEFLSRKIMNHKFVLIETATGRDLLAWVLPLPAIVGRSPDAQIVIDDPSISRRHCQFIEDPDGALTIRDLDSMNGIYIDDQRVKKAVLRPGIVVQIGSRSLRVEWTNEPVTSHPFSIKSDGRATQPMNTLPRPQS